jgi:cell division protein FtsW
VGARAGAGAVRAQAAVASPPVSAALGRKRFVVVLSVLLYLFGLVMITSAASGTSLLGSGDQWVFTRKQLMWGALGLVAFVVMSRVPLSFVRRSARPLLLVATGLLFLVFIPGFGVTVNGAARWLDFGPIQMQPSELVKVGVMVMIADHVASAPTPRHWMRDFYRSPAGVGLFLAGVIEMQHDLGTAMITAGTLLGLYVLAGTDWRFLMRAVGPVVALGLLSIVSEPFRRARFLAFLNPWHDPTGPGYQLVQGLVAIGSGGVFGVGLGHSVEKLHYLPEAHTDMIYAIIAEELGLVGIAIVLVGFAALGVVGMRIAARASDRFASLLAAGITMMLCGQALLNLTGVTGVMPLTGVPLPLISYGGSSLIITLASLGLLANIAVAGTHDAPGARGAAEPAAAPPAAAEGGRGRWRNRRAPGAGAGDR